jgi:exonuclease VII small subunit
MSIQLEAANERFRDARAHYVRLKSELAAACLRMNEAERDAAVEWQKVLDVAEKRASQ